MDLMKRQAHSAFKAKVDISCQTLSEQDLIKMRRVEGLKSLFLNSEQLKKELNTKPEGISKEALEAWQEFGPISVETIVQNSNLEDLDVDADDLKYDRKVYSGSV